MEIRLGSCSRSISKKFLNLSQNIFISSGNISQYSALKAFECIDYFNKIVDDYKENKMKILNELKNVKILKIKRTSGCFLLLFKY